MKYGLNAKQAKKTDDDKQTNYLVAMIWEEAELELLQVHQFDYFMESAVHLSLHFYVTATDSSQFGGNNFLNVVGLAYFLTTTLTLFYRFNGDLSLYLRLELIMGNSLSRSENLFTQGN